MAGKARRRDRLSILDMSIEDDSLLPGSAAASSCPVVMEDDDPPPEMRNQGSRDVTVEDAPVVAPVPPVRKIKKYHNLRKSLAWDKAFLTGEGVLDPDELPIPTRSSPKKLPELPTLEVKSSLHDECNTNVEKNSNRDSLRVKCFSERFDSRSKPLDISIIQGPDESARDTSGLPSPVVPRCAPAKKAIESAIQKGTRLRLPSTFTDERKTIPRPLKPQKESNLGKRVTSVSRRVKDTLGRVLPGRTDAFTAERSSAVRLSSDVSVTSEGEPSCSLQSCSVSDAHDEILEDLDTGYVSSLKEDQTKTNALLSEDSRSKPTALKMPSPKLGYFDAGRPTHHYATRAAVRIPPGMPSSKTKPHGLPKGKPPSTASIERISSAIPSAPHLRKVTSGEQENLKKKGHTDENSESSLKDGPVPSATKSPLGVNGGLLNSGPSVAKEKGSFFAFAKRAVGRLASPVQEKKKIWIATSCDGASTESSAEAIKEDGNILKPGPVQHSPPNKLEPQPGPWSPVRKNGTQLGPFDCTKSNAQVAWD